MLHVVFLFNETYKYLKKTWKVAVALMVPLELFVICMSMNGTCNLCQALLNSGNSWKKKKMCPSLQNVGF